MSPDWLTKVDRTALTITSLDDTSDERAFWLARTPLERLAALEAIRRTLYGYDPATSRLQRVLEIVERGKG